MRIVSLILALAAVVNPAAAEDFWFAAASDTHIRDVASTEIVREGIAMINADQRLAFSLWLGDLTDRSTAQEMALAKSTLATLQRPWHPCRGNHDVKDGLYEKHFGKLNYTFEHQGWTFIMLDSNGGRETLIDEPRMQWLREQIAAIDPERPIVLCCHHPLILGGVVPVAGAPEILELFADHTLKAVLAGHIHINQRHVVDGVLYTTTVCLATTRGNVDRDPRRGYRIFHCRDGQISTQFVTVREVPEEQPATAP
ncbi:MAG: metallophosphoesterase [Armatimonadota bacterium]|nr:metallophosphoesterase [Armatimonadota bacterium]